jgi:hypothetical protein
MLVGVAWFVVLPVYLIKTRGPRGILGIAGFVASLLVGWAFAVLVILLFWN